MFTFAGDQVKDGTQGYAKSRNKAIRQEGKRAQYGAGKSGLYMEFHVEGTFQRERPERRGRLMLTA